MKNVIAVLFEEIPDDLSLYLIEEGDIAQKFIECEGQYINDVNLSDEALIHEMYEVISALEKFDTTQPIPEDVRITRIIRCGFIS